MPWFSRCCCLLVAAGGAASLASAQAVISARAGVINYTEGSVLVDDRPLDRKFGTFPDIKQDSVLRTEKGRAEVILTPGAFLRLDENSSIRMSSTALSDTRIEFLTGSVILDTNNAAAGTPVALTYKTYTLHFSKPGVYRLDADPGVFESYTGEAQITAEGESPKTIDETHQFFFGIGAETNKYGDGAVDNFSEWCRNRAETLENDQRAAIQSTTDPSADPNASPFGGAIAVPDPGAVPSYGLPGAGSYGIGPTIVDNGFFGSFGPPYAPFYSNPVILFYVFPRPYGYGLPRNSVPPRLRSTYPGLPSRASYPRLAPWHPSATTAWRPSATTAWRPTPVPARGTSSYYRAPAARGYAAPARSTPTFHPAAPAGGGIAIHHR